MASRSVAYKSLLNSTDIDADSVSVASLLDLTGAEVIGFETTKLATDVIVPATNSYVQIGDGVYIGVIGGKNNTIVSDYLIVNNAAELKTLTILSQLLLPDGSAIAPASSFTSDPSTGMYLSSAGVLGFSTGGTSRVSMSSIGLGVVGDITVTGDVDGVDISAFYADYISKINQALLTTSSPTFNTITLTSGTISVANIVASTITASTSITTDLIQGRTGPLILEPFGAPTASMTISSVSGTITVPFTAGTNAITGGAISCSSLISSGTLSAVGITSTSTITAGTNAITGGVVTAGTKVVTNAVTGNTGSLVLSASAGTPTWTVSTSSLACSSSSSSLITTNVRSTGLGGDEIYVSNAAGTDYMRISSGIMTYVTSLTAQMTVWPGVSATFNMPLSCGTYSLLCGPLSAGSVFSSGTISCGTNSMTCGSLTSGAITSSGAFSCGTNSATCGALSCGAITSSGTVSCGAITSSGAFSCGTNSATCGALSCSSVTATGTITCGTNAATAGAISCTSLVSSTKVTGTTTVYTPFISISTNLTTSTTGFQSVAGGFQALISASPICTFSAAGINLAPQALTSGSISAGAITCTSLLSSGTMSCGTSALTCGALSSSSITATGTFTCGTNSATVGALSSGAITSSAGISCGGTFSCFPNAATVGSLTSGAITALAGTFTSLLSSGTMSCGTNALTCGALSVGSVSTAINAGTNALTCGTVSCGSILSSGQIQCGATSPTWPQGALVCVGTASGTDTNPCINFMFSGDTRPIAQFMPFARDNHTWTMDAAWRSSWVSNNSTSNMQIEKASSLLSFKYASGVAIGSTITWSTALSINSSGTLSLGSASTLQFPDGSVSAPSITFSNNTNMGLYRIGASDLGVSVGGVLQAELTTSAFKATQKVTTPMVILSNISSSDFYVEGTWTAVAGDSKNNFTLSSNLCYYTRIGNMIQFNISITWSSKGSATGGFQITLPFTSNATKFQNAAFSIGYMNGVSPAYGSVTATTSGGSTNLVTFYVYSMLGVPSLLFTSSMGATGQIGVSGTYSI